MNLRVELVGHKAAKFACSRWHYSKSVPAGRKVVYGIWEGDSFVGVIIYSRGANQHLGSAYGLGHGEFVELTRVAMRNHRCFVTQPLAYSLRHIKRTQPGLRAVLSFADPAQGHEGSIYKASNWTYLGQSDESVAFVGPDGKSYHRRQVSTIA